MKIKMKIKMINKMKNIQKKTPNNQLNTIRINQDTIEILNPDLMTKIDLIKDIEEDIKEIITTNQDIKSMGDIIDIKTMNEDNIKERMDMSNIMITKEEILQMFKADKNTEIMEIEDKITNKIIVKDEVLNMEEVEITIEIEINRDTEKEIFDKIIREKKIID